MGQALNRKSQKENSVTRTRKKESRPLPREEVGPEGLIAPGFLEKAAFETHHR